MVMSIEEKAERKEQRRLDNWNRQHKFIKGVDHKLCNRCNEFYPANEENFYPNKSNGIDGLNPYCNVCAINGASKWSENNHEKVLISKRKHNKTPKAKKAMQENSKEWRESGKQLKNQRKIKDKIRGYNKKRATKKHVVSINEWDSCRLYFNYSCAYCEVTYEDHYKKYKQDLHKEHVDDEGTNDLSNCVPSCRNCNSQKRIRAFEEWYNKDNRKFTLERYYKIITWLGLDYKSYFKI